jgi:hypothetical protein
MGVPLRGGGFYLSFYRDQFFTIGTHFHPYDIPVTIDDPSVTDENSVTGVWGVRMSITK